MSSERKIGLGGLDTSRSHRSATVDCRKNGGNVMARSMQVPRTSPARRHAKMIALLLVVGVAIVVVSAMSVAPLHKAAEPKYAETSRQPPGSPYPVAGYTYDADGVTKLPGCSVVLTDVTVGATSPVLTSNANGYYSTSLGDWCSWSLGDVITIHAEKGVMYGENQGVVAGTGLVLHVTLNLEIPEFPFVALPIVGMVGLFVAVRVISRRD